MEAFNGQRRCGFRGEIDVGVSLALAANFVGFEVTVFHTATARTLHLSKQPRQLLKLDALVADNKYT